MCSQRTWTGDNRRSCHRSNTGGSRCWYHVLWWFVWVPFVAIDSWKMFWIWGGGTLLLALLAGAVLVGYTIGRRKQLNQPHPQPLKDDVDEEWMAFPERELMPHAERRSQDGLHAQKQWFDDERVDTL